MSRKRGGLRGKHKRRRKAKAVLKALEGKEYVSDLLECIPDIRRRIVEAIARGTENTMINLLVTRSPVYFKKGR